MTDENLIANRDRVEMLLAQYASGSLSPFFGALIEAHLEMREDSRRWIETVEACCGAILDSGDGVPLRDRDRMLETIFARDDAESVVAKAGASKKPEGGSAVVLPASVQQLLDCPFEDIPWKSGLPGMKTYRIAKDNGTHASLYWIKAGHTIPAHTHEGLEATLVLSGGFADVNGHFVRGDIAISDATVDHKPVVDADEDCVCLVVVDAPLRLTGPIGRLISPFLPKN